MKTGEGKTLVATLPAYLNGLTGSRRPYRHGERLSRAPRCGLDGSALHRFLGLSVGAHRARPLRRRATRSPTAADIAYCTNNELGFDYLRDNMKFDDGAPASSESSSTAIVDEVDSILIDEARTPLIISGPSEENTQLYGRREPHHPQPEGREPRAIHAKGIEETGDYWLDEKAHSGDADRERDSARSRRCSGVENLYEPSGCCPCCTAVSQALHRPHPEEDSTSTTW